MVKVLDPRDGYNWYADAYASDHRKLDAFDREIFRSQLPTMQLDCALEIGVGDGRVSNDIYRISNRVIGVDVAEDILARAAERVPRVEGICADMTRPFPFRDNQFDLVVAAFFFVHVPDPDPVLAEVYRVLKPEGRFVFNLIPQRKEPELKVGRERFKIRSWYHSPPQVEKLLDYYWFSWEVETVSEGKGWISKVYNCTRD